jgi:putative intracellular protease/amidase
MKISILAFDHFTDLDLILHWDILNRVKYIGGVENWSVKIVGTKPSHVSALGLPIPTSGAIEEISSSDVVIICSGKGTRVLLNDREYLQRLNLDPAKQFIGAQCSGSLILGALEYLKGVQVSAYPPILSELRGYGAELVDRGLVVDGKLATASSCIAGQFLSKWMIDTLVGTEIGNRVMNTVLPLGS